MEFLDQFLHFLWVFGALAAYRFIPLPVINGIVAALVFSLPRELVDQWPIERPWDTVLDLSFFVYGGIAFALTDLLVTWLQKEHRLPK